MHSARISIFNYESPTRKSQLGSRNAIRPRASDRV